MYHNLHKKYKTSSFNDVLAITIKQKANIHLEQLPCCSILYKNYDLNEICTMICYHIKFHDPTLSVASAVLNPGACMAIMLDLLIVQN
jgi:hypothetical protein